ncbi:hypothetical protein [Mesorhizobium sp. M6A.T.Ce.TU.016.01.1.1]|uniref:hypothetical protein n=1 Tax=Mesorhizobium sp. M6A.T.Ce.TU.016.01.1.1 TaxID=2496783 RepID=UPI000FCC1AD6|nr:hypothetical protein [Mesorhizobium sp. M6A.T.Ce.TU.016.01.1.1]RUU29716.1 hypothetical protein EOC94_12660 [Mesorhizobium sp. M6A.T.Ce.TU.016.01.1.1]
MAIDRALAAQAYHLSKKGLKGKAIGETLKVTTAEANTLAGYRLTESERLGLRLLAEEHRWRLDRGDISSPKSHHISARARKGAGWFNAMASKRLFTRRWSDKEKRDLHGLGFVDLAGNGHVWLTAAGWAFVLATEVSP